jgi:hypothetical protein
VNPSLYVVKSPQPLWLGAFFVDISRELKRFYKKNGVTIKLQLSKLVIICSSSFALLLFGSSGSGSPIKKDGEN